MLNSDERVAAIAALQSWEQETGFRVLSAWDDKHGKFSKLRVIYARPPESYFDTMPGPAYQQFNHQRFRVSAMEVRAYVRNTFERQLNLEETNTHNSDCFFPWTRDAESRPLVLHSLLDPFLERAIETHERYFVYAVVMLAESAIRAVPHNLTHHNRDRNVQLGEDAQKTAGYHLGRALHYLDLATQMVASKKIPAFDPLRRVSFDDPHTLTRAYAPAIAQLQKAEAAPAAYMPIGNEIKTRESRVLVDLGVSGGREFPGIEYAPTRPGRPCRIYMPDRERIFPEMSHMLRGVIQHDQGLVSLNPKHFAKAFRSLTGEMCPDERVTIVKSPLAVPKTTHFRL